MAVTQAPPTTQPSTTATRRFALFRGVLARTGLDARADRHGDLLRGAESGYLSEGNVSAFSKRAPS
jgi:hypothetical protein